MIHIGKTSENADYNPNFLDMDRTDYAGYDHHSVLQNLPSYFLSDADITDEHTWFGLQLFKRMSDKSSEEYALDIDLLFDRIEVKNSK
jgi:hypothetical protein